MERRATLIGFMAVILWSGLAVLTAISGPVPPFQLAAMTFAIGAAVGMASIAMRPGAARALRQPLSVWAIGVGGLFGYHALYFTALKSAPPAEAGLLNYLWPLLIVLLSGLLPGERLRPHHVVGALLGLAGTIVLFAFSQGVTLRREHMTGYAAALLAAFVWAGYSVLSRRAAAVPSDAVAGFCLATALLATLVHAAVEPTVWPRTGTEWAAVVALGLGPVGLAFYAWDYGMKRGDIRVLGALSYAAPVLSTALLVVFGFAHANAALAFATALIAGGGLVAAKDLRSRR